ncbi:hypothetical protein ANN_26115 [Periplaneta americana]|uniref:Uncharacterized protein n=1 Tax=Periplaneta americana TaxID=6978 RepID=A0ABQ8S514_PERAM|nr:hypothetical protein ANN_26115 [Periplaneta americana]
MVFDETEAEASPYNTWNLPYSWEEPRKTQPGFTRDSVVNFRNPSIMTVKISHWLKKQGISTDSQSTYGQAFLVID